MSKSNKEISMQQFSETVLDRLIESGVVSVEECLRISDLNKTISLDSLQVALTDNPFVGRNPNFQDLIENAVLGNNIKNGGK